MKKHLLVIPIWLVFYFLAAEALSKRWTKHSLRNWSDFCLVLEPLRGDKSDLMILIMEEEVAYAFQELFLLQEGWFFHSGSWVPLHHSKLRKGNLHPIVDKIIKIIVGWKGRLLSYAAKLTPKNHVLQVFQFTSHIFTWSRTL